MSNQLVYSHLSLGIFVFADIFSVFQFGFKCGYSDHAEGMSIPLLSLTIAALMAVFLDQELAPLVSQSALTFVIRNATSGLLDPRLTSTHNGNLDELTCKKMVKAINKVRFSIQCSTMRLILS